MYYAMTLPGRDDDDAECLEARVSVGGPCASRRCSPPGGLHVSGTRLHRSPVPRPRDPFKCPTARRPDPQELLGSLFNHHSIFDISEVAKVFGVTAFTEIRNSLLQDFPARLILFPKVMNKMISRDQTERISRFGENERES